MFSLRVIVAATLAAVADAALTYSLGRPTQCDNMSISWTGGQGPYSLTIWPVFGRPSTINIPDGAFNNGKGSFQTQITIPAGKGFVTTLSDATGFNSGGTTQVITVGPSLGGSCNTTSPNVDFQFETNDALVQCRTYSFSNYDTAKQPVTIYAIVPGGQILTLNPPVGPTEFDWTADAATGTSFIFSMVGADGGQGGSSDIKIVGASDNSTCLDSSAPTSTANPPAASTPAGPPSPGSSSAPDPTTPSSKPSLGLIVGTILGAIVFLACIGSMIVFFVRRHLLASGQYPYRDRHSRMLGSVDLLGAAHNSSGSLHGHRDDAPPYPGATSALSRVRSPFDDPEPTSPGLPAGHQLEPFPLTSPTGTSFAGGPHDPSDAGSDAGRSRYTSAATSARRTKAAMAGMQGYQPPSRFILHTDLDEPIPDENGVIELPPQYVEGRRPLAIPVAGAPAASSSSSSSSSAQGYAPTPRHQQRVSMPPPPLSPPPPSLTLSHDAFSDVGFSDGFSDLHLGRRS